MGWLVVWGVHTHVMRAVNSNASRLSGGGGAAQRPKVVVVGANKKRGGGLVGEQLNPLTLSKTRPLSRQIGQEHEAFRERQEKMFFAEALFLSLSFSLFLSNQGCIGFVGVR